MLDEMGVRNFSISSKHYQELRGLNAVTNAESKVDQGRDSVWEKPVFNRKPRISSTARSSPKPQLRTIDTFSRNSQPCLKLDEMKLSETCRD